MGDTGELVKAAFGLFVAHPPGYPLATLMSHIFIKLFSFGTIFWRASLLTAFYSVVTCYLISRKANSVPLIGLGVALLFASTRIFWRYSVLPDVFALNCLFASAIIFLYLDTHFVSYRKWIPFIFMIGLTNHLSLLFLFPLPAHIFVKNMKSKSQWLICFAALGFFIGIYSLLFFFHPEDFESWGQVTSFTHLLDHFLRKDYGTFSLVSGTQSSTLVTNLYYLWKQASESFLVLVIVSLLAFIRRLFLKNFLLEEYIYTFAMLAYIFGFFYLSNMEISGPRIELIERFFILANLLFFYWGLTQIVKSNFPNIALRLIALTLALSAFYNVYRFYKLNNFSKNTVIEDYALNFLNQANAEKETLLITLTDTRYNAIKYAQNVIAKYPRVVVTHPSLLFFKWYPDKLKRQNMIIGGPELNPGDTQNVEESLVVPNLKQKDILTNLQFTSEQLYLTAMQPIAKILSPGKGLYIANLATLNKINMRSGYQDIYSNEKEYDVARELLSEYSTYYTTLGNILSRGGQIPEGRLYYEKALQINPWATNAKEKLCNLELKANTDACLAELEILKQKYYRYF